MIEFWLAAIIIGAGVLFLMFFTVDRKICSIVERFGKFNRISQPGLNFKIPFIKSISGKLSLRVCQLDIEVETKTKENVFAMLIVAGQYGALESKIYEAYYMLQNLAEQIFDRAQVPLIDFDDAWAK